MGYSFSLQDIVTLTVKSILCMIPALSAHGELHLSLHPFFPPTAERGGTYREMHSLVLGLPAAERAGASPTWVSFQALLSSSISSCCIPACAEYGIASHGKTTEV